MAHTAKYKAHAAGQLGAHIDRSRPDDHAYANVNIDPSRTWLNYDLCGHTRPLPEVVAAAIDAAPRTVRKDAVLLGSTVVTLPKNWPANRDPREFFEAVRAFDLSFWPPSYVEVRATVHMDETTPHIHHTFLPLGEDGQPAWAKTYTRAMYRRYHERLSKYVRDATHLPDLAILLPDDDPEKALSDVPQRKLDASRAAMTSDLEATRREAEEAARRAQAEAEAAEERLERLRRKCDGAEAAAAASSELERKGVIRYVRDHRDDPKALREAQAEERALEIEGERARARVRELERGRADLAARVREHKRERAGLERQIARAKAAIQQLRMAITRTLRQYAATRIRAPVRVRPVYGHARYMRAKAYEILAKKQAKRQLERGMHGNFANLV